MGDRYLPSDYANAYPPYFTPLHIAVLRSRPDEISYLLNTGANPNGSSAVYPGNNPSPLHVAAKHALPMWIIKLLRFHGADVNWRDENGSTPLMYCLTSDEDKAETNMGALLMPLRTNKERVAPGANPNLANLRGYTALHLAAVKNDEMSIRTLLHYGASPAATTDEGFTPFYLSTTQEAMRLLR